MAYKGIRLSDEDQARYADGGARIQAIEYNRFLMKKFVFRGPEQEIVRLLSYVETNYHQQNIISKIDEDISETSVCLDDKKMLADFPMLKASGFVLETDNDGRIIQAGVVFKDSGYRYPNEYKRLIEYQVDIDENTYAYSSRAFCWPIDKNPTKDFKTHYKNYNPSTCELSGKQVFLTYEFPYGIDWDDGKYIFLSDDEYYLYDSGSNFVIEDRVLKRYEGNQKIIGVPSNVDVIADGAFKGNKDVIKISLPGLQEIGNETFAECSNLKQIELKKTLTRIGNDAFARCERLVELEIPDSVREIGEGAFFKCGVGRVVWPKGVTAIPTGMFRECSNLYEIVIPPEVREIGRRVFSRSNTIIIYGQPGSYAEQYAKDNGMFFKPYGFEES